MGFFEEILKITFGLSDYSLTNVIEEARRYKEYNTEVVSRLKHIRNECIKLPPFQNKRISALACGECRIDNINYVALCVVDDSGDFSFYYSAQDAKYLSITNQLLFSPEEVLLAFSPLIPCFAFGGFSTTKFEFIQEFMLLYGDNQLNKNMTEQEFSLINTAINAWKSTVHYELLGVETYNNWKKCIDKYEHILLTQKPSLDRSQPQKYNQAKRPYPTKGYQSEKESTWGTKGENNVEYELQWLGEKYILIKKDCINKFGHMSIILKDQVGRVQEFDHIVIGEKYVYNIETKFYKGTIIIKENGNWVRQNDNGDETGTKNPISQVDRHHKMLEQILKESISGKQIIDVICIAHANAIIQGEKNSPVPVIKYDMLRQFIVQHEKKFVPKINSRKIAEIIEKSKIKKKR